MTSENKGGLIIEGINKRFGDVEVLKDVTLEVRSGEFFTLLGPSGCGKTTLLRIIAGLELPDTGRINLCGQDITSLPATKRQVNTVFQSYALFPHLSIFENVAFGLRSRKFADEVVTERVEKRLEMLGLLDMGDRYPDQLSGGQKQRVALARALVNEPEILLLDEPMSALDAKLRAKVQEDLRRIQRRLGRTFLMVTHDQSEALVCSDRLAVMHEGRVIQYGHPEEVYDFPKTRFVAEFLGAANLIEAKKVPGGADTRYGILRLDEEPSWTRGLLAIRPEWIRIGEKQPGENGVRARVSEVIYRGTSFDLWLEPGPLRVRTSSYRHFRPGDEVWLELAADELTVLEDDA
ncbi:ABC transporter ATP-binding protein [Desulfococcaceae bacterium HSG8]|nr:ABC transporter ATP-binding protein [Desulfococcaceae bacterium HSG8]